MDGSLVFIPPPLPFIGIGVLVVAAVAESRQGYIGRIGIASNAFLLWQIFFPHWDMLPMWFQGYLNLGTFVGVLALLFYLARESLPTEFYQLSYILYGSMSVLVALALSLTLGIPLLQP